MSPHHRRLAVLGACAAVAFSAAGPASAAWSPQRELPGSEGRYPLLAALGADGARNIGPLGGRLRRIRTGTLSATLTLAAAVNDRGDAAIVFSRCRGRRCDSRSILATYRRRGGRFRKPITLARRTTTPTAAVALNDRGDALFAWEQRRSRGRGVDVRVRQRRSSGRLSKPRLVGSTAPRPTIAVTLTRGRSGAVAWFSQPVSEGSVGGDIKVAAAKVRSDGTVTARRTLDRRRRRDLRRARAGPAGGRRRGHGRRRDRPERARARRRRRARRDQRPRPGAGQRAQRLSAAVSARPAPADRRCCAR